MFSTVEWSDSRTTYIQVKIKRVENNNITCILLGIWITTHIHADHFSAVDVNEVYTQFTKVKQNKPLTKRNHGLIMPRGGATAYGSSFVCLSFRLLHQFCGTH